MAIYICSTHLFAKETFCLWRKPDGIFVWQAISATWGGRCDKLFFVLDDIFDTVPDKIGNGTVLKLQLDHEQTTRGRNIWEKVLFSFVFFFMSHQLRTVPSFKVEPVNMLIILARSQSRFPPHIRFGGKNRDWTPRQNVVTSPRQEMTRDFVR